MDEFLRGRERLLGSGSKEDRDSYLWTLRRKHPIEADFIQAATLFFHPPSRLEIVEILERQLDEFRDPDNEYRVEPRWAGIPGLCANQSGLEHPEQPDTWDGGTTTWEYMLTIIQPGERFLANVYTRDKHYPPDPEGFDWKVYDTLTFSVPNEILYFNGLRYSR